MRYGRGSARCGGAMRHKIWESATTDSQDVVGAPGRGFEPRLTDPESAVLPLDDPGLSRQARLAAQTSYHTPRPLSRPRTGADSPQRPQKESRTQRTLKNAKGHKADEESDAAAIDATDNLNSMTASEAGTFFSPLRDFAELGVLCVSTGVTSAFTACFQSVTSRTRKSR
jgi:hypothetical protein